MAARAPLRTPGPPTSALSVVQVVRSNAFAGVERYMCQVANGLVSRGHHLTVVGGDPDRMHSELDGLVDYRAADTVLRTARALAGERHADVVHVHMTAAEGAAWLARPFQRAPIVATRHFPGDRGSGRVARALAHVAARPIARDIAISRFVAEGIDGPTVLLHNAVPDQPQADAGVRHGPDAAAPDRGEAPRARDQDLGRQRPGRRPGGGSSSPARGTGTRPCGTLADELGVADSVDFVGQIADTDRLLGESSILLATPPAEPFGFSVVEAMAHGVPVVAAAGGAHVETMGDAGMLFPPGDAARRGPCAGRALRRTGTYDGGSGRISATGNGGCSRSSSTSTASSTSTPRSSRSTAGAERPGGMGAVSGPPVPRTAPR